MFGISRIWRLPYTNHQYCAYEFKLYKILNIKTSEKFGKISRNKLKNI